MEFWNRIKRKFLPDIFGLFLLLLAIFWFAREMIWDDKVPFFRDLGTYFYPLRFSLAQAYGAHELPLWDRHPAMGFPLLADFQSAAFYPPHLVFLVLPFFPAIRLIFLLHYIVAGSGSYLLFRRWNYPSQLAVLGAMLFTLGGTMISLTNLLNHFQSAVWLPWSLLFWERYLAMRSWVNFMFLTLVLLVQLLAGSPEVYVLTMALLLVRGFTSGSAQALREYARAFCLLLLVNVAVALLGMVQLLPTAELLVESRRQEPIPYPEAINWSLNPLSLMNLFFLDKQVSTQGSGAQIFFGQSIPFLISYYMGAVALFGICFWLFNSSWKEKLFLGLLLTLSITLAFGNFTPIYPFLYRHVPPFGTLRYPEKFFFFTHALLLYIVLEGVVEFFRSEGERSRRGLAFVAIVWSLMLMLYAFLRLNPEVLHGFVSRATALRLPQELTVNSTASLLVNIERQLGLWLGLLLLFYGSHNGFLRSSLTHALLGLIVFVDLTWAHQSYQYLLKPDFISQGPRILRAPQAEPSRLFYYPPGPNLHPSYFSLRKEPQFDEVFSILFKNLFPNSGIFYGFDYMQDINALGTRSYIDFLRFAHTIEPERRFRLLGALNVKYVISFAPLSVSGITLARHFPEYPSWLYEVKPWVPRVNVVNKVQVENEPYKILERLTNADFDPLKTVILDRPVLPPTNGNAPFVARTKILNYANHRVSIQASLNHGGVVVLADTFYPGWRVFVNGVETGILRANYFFRGVLLGAGEHLVEFRYEPRAFRIGAVISLLSLAGVMAISLFLYFAKHKNRV
jgi:hypothetical protein